ncbi:hypothetical protein H5T52_10285 [Candidatus Bipolaricaulota bacterium]|nr:hypothetical protein [Candidatus Bipolaricaulota bacterium]
MGKVRQAYERIQTLHSIARQELTFEEDHGCERSRFEIEMWFKRPKLRVESRPLTSPPPAATLAPQMIIADGEHEYRFSGGKWVKTRRWWGSVDLLEILGLLPRAVYMSKQQGELFGCPAWVVQGRIGDGVQATWWVDTDTLTVRKYKLEGLPQPLFGSDSALEMKVATTVEFQKFEPGVEVLDEKFLVPSDIPIDEHPTASFFEELLRVLKKEG